MPVVTKSVNDPIRDLFKHEDNLLDDTFTGYRIIPSKKKPDFNENLQSEIDNLINKIGTEPIINNSDDSTIVTGNIELVDEDKKENGLLKNEERLKLLSRKYVKKELNREEYTRLEILREKVRKLLPRVTTEDFERLEIVGKELEEFKEENKRIREEYNLD